MITENGADVYSADETAIRFYDAAQYQIYLRDQCNFITRFYYQRRTTFFVICGIGAGIAGVVAYKLIRNRE